MSANLKTYHITVVDFSGLPHRQNRGCCGLNGFVRVSSDPGENSSTLFYVNSILSTAFGICCYTDTGYALCKRKNMKVASLSSTPMSLTQPLSHHVIITLSFSTLHQKRHNRHSHSQDNSSMHYSLYCYDI
jgi:hypothetical protein